MPLICFTEFFLGIWLKGELPPQVVLFIQLAVVFTLTEALAAPFWTGIQATGKIALYQVSVSAIISSAFFIGWFLFALKLPAWWVMVLNILASVACHLYRIVHLKIATGFPLGRYVVRSMVPVVAVSFVCALLTVKTPLIACLTCPLVVIAFGVSGEERRIVLSAVRKRLGR